MSYTVTRSTGEMLSDYPMERFGELIDSLRDTDAEHPDISVTHESEWSLTLDRSGGVVLEKLDGGDPRSLGQLDRAASLDLMIAVAAGRLVEVAVRTYIRAAGERDPTARAKLLEACFADDARLVTRSSVIRGRAAIDALIARFFADEQNLGFRMTSVIDAKGTTFRYASVVLRADGSELPFFDAGEIDESGRITTLLLFAGSLADA